MKKIVLVLYCVAFMGCFSTPLLAQNGVTAGVNNDRPETVTMLEGFILDTAAELSEGIGIFVKVAVTLVGLGFIIYIVSTVLHQMHSGQSLNLAPLIRPALICFLLFSYTDALRLVRFLINIPTEYAQYYSREARADVAVMLEQHQKALEESNLWLWYYSNNGAGDQDAWIADNSINDGWMGIPATLKFQMERAQHYFNHKVKSVMYKVFQIIYYVAYLSLFSLQRFYMLILEILGPLAIAAAVWPGFGGSLLHWLMRYIHVGLWVPVLSLYSYLIDKSQLHMIDNAITTYEVGGDVIFNPSDIGYLTFMLVAAIGYLAVPTVASWIVTPGHSGMGSHMRRVNSSVSAAGGYAGSAAGSLIRGGSNTAINVASSGAGLLGGVVLGGAAYLAKKYQNDERVKKLKS